MFLLSLFVGIYSYVLFFLGLAGLLYKELILALTILWLFLIVYSFKDKLKLSPREPFTFFEKAILISLATLFFINFLNLLVPEITFDALWYHLTIPEIYLSVHKVFFIPGGLLYYSALPKLGEMLFLPGMVFDGTVLTKIVQFLFGILSLLAIYRFSRLFLPRNYSLLSSLIFYSNIVVSWESGISYIDLVWAFFELMTFWTIFLFFKNGRVKNLLYSGVFAGFAVSTKLLSIRIIPVFVLLFLIHRWRNGERITLIRDVSIFIITAGLVVSPWLLFSYLSTGNPVYPFFTDIYKLKQGNLLDPATIFREFKTLFLFSPDPVSPVYMISLPIILVYFKKLNSSQRLLVTAVFLGLLVWYLTFQSGAEGRYALPLLTTFSILVSVVIYKSQTGIKNTMLFTVFLISTSTIAYRGLATARYLPVIVGAQTKDSFLSNNLNFSFGDFYDTDGFFRKSINSTDKVLLYGFHNLFYVDFPFIDSSFVKIGDRFDFIAVQSSNLPSRFSSWKLIYTNNKTNVKVYSLKGKWETY